MAATLVKYPKWRTESWPGLYANQVNGVNNDGNTTYKFNLPLAYGVQCDKLYAVYRPIRFARLCG